MMRTITIYFKRAPFYKCVNRDFSDRDAIRYCSKVATVASIKVCFLASAGSGRLAELDGGLYAKVMLDAACRSGLAGASGDGTGTNSAGPRKKK
jgi:hypothetical protein